jgi:hypothetical protein
VLEKWIEETGDRGRVFEPADVIAAQGATKAARVTKRKASTDRPGKGSQKP